MKEKLDHENRIAIVNYRLERAYFVRTGCLSLEHGATFSLLFEKRQSSDYSDFAYCDFALVDTLRPRAEAFINAVESLTWKKE